MRFVSFLCAIALGGVATFTSPSAITSERFFPEIPPVSVVSPSTAPRKSDSRLPYSTVLRCVNLSEDGESHYAAYLFSYDYVAVDTSLDITAINKVLDGYFAELQSYLEEPAYERIETQNILLDAVKNMKMYLNETEADTGVKLFFSPFGMYWSLIEGVDDAYYASLFATEDAQLALSKLDFDMDISWVRPDDTVFVGR